MADDPIHDDFSLLGELVSVSYKKTNAEKRELGLELLELCIKLRRYKGMVFLLCPWSFGLAKEELIVECGERPAAAAAA